MAVFTEPKKWGVVPGNAADVSEIQEEGSSLYPSLADFFPAIYQLALSAGGKAPERTTFNALFKMIMERLYFIERGGVWSYDATADYPAGAVVGYSGSLYLALKDNGSGTDAGAVQPDADGEAWQRLETAADVRSNWYATYPDGAEAHNAMWGGRDITAAFNAGTVSEHIADGTFKDIFPGDYITKQVTISGTAYTVNWVVADCDYWINKGDTAMTAHHVAIVPQAPIFSANMNATNTTEGGYAGSAMYRNIIPACATGIVNAFGSSHILTFRDHLTRDLNTSAVSSGITVFTGAPNWNGAWYSQQCNLMSEAMVYDGPHCASSALDNIMATRQMSAFRLSEKLINYNRSNWWLRDVVSSARFALVAGYGNADTLGASLVFGVRPFALLR